MADALNYLYYIYDSWINFIFNSATIFPSVSLGWVIVVVIVFTLLIHNLLTHPEKGREIYKDYQEQRSKGK